MSRPFQFKEFQVIQAVNAQKVGTDAMLLGAWVDGSFERILDIGTGTGILALMCAQKFDKASITGIEPHPESLEEAQLNFQNSPYTNRILPICTSLQRFGTIEPFDLIITNPPYFETSFLSADEDRNRARHTHSLPIHELYEHAYPLLSETGTLAVVFPSDLEEKHLHYAHVEELYPHTVLRTLSPNGKFKRSLIQFSKNEMSVTEDTLLVKNENNQYSDAYISLTKDFYNRDLSQR